MESQNKQCRGPVEWTPRGSCFLTLIGRCCRQDRSRSNSSSFLGGKKDSAIFFKGLEATLLMTRHLVHFLLICTYSETSWVLVKNTSEVSVAA